MMMIDRRASSVSMEATLMFHGHGSLSPDPYKSQPKRIINNHFVAANMQQMGILQAPHPPFVSQSYPLYSHHHHHPPLLPLPTADHRRDATLNRGLSCPPVNKKLINPTRKPKSPTKKDARNSPKKSSLGSLSTSPKDLSKDVHMYSKNNTTNFGYSSNNTNFGFSSTNKLASVNNEKRVENRHVVLESKMFSGSVVDTTISPPPSSLPLPTFSMRPKLSCKVQAGGIDTREITDDLRRLLRIH